MKYEYRVGYSETAAINVDEEMNNMAKKKGWEVISYSESRILYRRPILNAVDVCQCGANHSSGTSVPHDGNLYCPQCDKRC